LAPKSVNRPAAGERHEVSTGAAAVRVVSLPALPDFTKNIGYGVFRVGAMVQDAFTEREHFGSESVVQRAERAAVAAADGGH
jgi:hypothetical protein